MYLMRDVEISFASRVALQAPQVARICMDKGWSWRASCPLGVTRRCHAEWRSRSFLVDFERDGKELIPPRGIVGVGA